MTFFLIIAGGLVTSNDAGLAVPDWPLSYGTWLPPMVGNIVYEHGHRMVAAFVGLLTVVLTAWLLWAEPRRWVRWLGVGALASVVAQGILGGITVLFLLPRPVSIGHASLAQVFFCLTVSLVFFTSPTRWLSPERAVDSNRPALEHLCWATSLAIFVQLILGAAFRHSALGLVPHLVGAGVVVLLVAWTAKRIRQRHPDQPSLQRGGLLLAGLVAMQLTLGGAAYWSRLATVNAPQPQLFMVVLTVAHVALGALILAASLWLTLQVRERLHRPDLESSFTRSAERVTA